MRAIIASLILFSFAASTPGLAQSRSGTSKEAPPPKTQQQPRENERAQSQPHHHYHPTTRVVVYQPALYGPCLPIPYGQLGSTYCIANPLYRPNLTLDTYDAQDLYREEQARIENAEIREALADVAAELERFKQVAAQMKEDEQDAAEARVIQAQRQLEQSYRSAWWPWAKQWKATAPQITNTLAALADAAQNGDAEGGCAYFTGWADEQTITPPPTPDEKAAALHEAFRDLRQQCSAGIKDPSAIASACDAASEAVEATSEWAEGRSAYYASATP